MRSVDRENRPPVRPSACPTNPGCSPAARILFLADTHLGFDLPLRPRVDRRRRGIDFMANFERILETALSERVDCIVHGGDLFYRSRIPASLVQMVFLPMKKVADAGIPIFIVPGNHERSRIPYDMLALHPRIFVFDRPRTFVEDLNGTTVALAGFPYWRNKVRTEFSRILEATEWHTKSADVNLLCAHHCFEGAIVGPQNYVFRYGSDVIRLEDVPKQFAAVLTGHVHRSQVLKHDLRERALDVPVFYPGSIERTSFAERDEEKGYFILELEGGTSAGGVVRRQEFRRLPTRPMVVKELDANDMGREGLENAVRRTIAQLPKDAVLQLRILGSVQQDGRQVLGANFLRSLAPPTMNVEARLVNVSRET